MNHDEEFVTKEQVGSEKQGRSETDQKGVADAVDSLKDGSMVENEEVSLKQDRSENNTLDQVKAGGPSKGSWVEIAQDKKSLKKYEIEITEQEGQKVVEIPDDVIENVNHLCDDFLIGKFLDSTPHIARVHAIVNKIWSQGGNPQKIEVYGVDSTTMKFSISDPLMRARILKRGMWNIGNIPLIVTKWTPEELEEKPEVKSIPLWVHLKNVPMHMFSWQGLSFITRSVVTPVRLHPDTASSSNFKVAKIFVNADLSKELPMKINFTKNRTSSLVEFSYPWLPLRCLTCKKWGHVEKSCVMNKKDGVSLSDQQKNKELNKEGKNKKYEEEIKAAESASALKENESAVASNTEIEEGQIIEEWEDIISWKFKRSPTKRMLKYGQVKILTPSRFLILNEINDNGELMSEAEKQDEIDTVEENVMEKELTETEHMKEDGNNEEEIIEEVVSSVEGDKDDETRSEKTIIEEGSKTEEEQHEAETEKIKEDNKSGEEKLNEEMQKEAVVKSPTYCDIVRSESGKEVQTQE